MLIHFALLGYAVVLHLLLIFLLARGNHWKRLYQNVLLDAYALERVRVFFQTLEPVLKVLYRFLDRLRSNTGRPPTDYRFQFRFVLWWKFFHPVPLAAAVRRFNKSPALKQILAAPAAPYTRFSLRRFMKKLAGGTVPKMCFWLVADLVKKGILDLSQVIIDSFPIYSFLNTAKCLRMPKFETELAQQFFSQLNLVPILQLLPKAHGRAAPYADKIKCWIHHHLWDVPSLDKCHQLVFGKEARYKVMDLLKGWKSAPTYRNFIEAIVQLPNGQEIEQAVVCEVARVLTLLDVKPKIKSLKTLEDLRQVFHIPLRLKDPGISLAYCSSKKQTFMGRGGLVIASKHLELPLLVDLTSKYKQSEQSILSFLNTLHHAFGQLVKDVEIFGDSEFGTQGIQEALEKLFQAQVRIESYGKSKKSYTMSKEDKKIRVVIERVIARMNEYFQVEHPRMLGPGAVAVHTHLCWLCDLLLVIYNILDENIDHPNAIRKIRG